MHEKKTTAAFQLRPKRPEVFPAARSINEDVPKAGIYFDYARQMEDFKTAIGECPQFAYGMVKTSQDIATEIYNNYGKPWTGAYERERRRAKTSEQKSRFLSDPGHAFGVGVDTSIYSTFVKSREFVKEVHSREKKAGRNPIILTIYSSNPGPYTEQIDALKCDGIIAGSWHKRDFTPAKLIETVNKELNKRSM